MSVVEPGRAEELLARKQYDLVIKGATWSGISAAFSAAANGVKNILVIDDTSYIGGAGPQSGISPFDIITRNQCGGTPWQDIQKCAVIDGVITSGGPSLRGQASLTGGNPGEFLATYLGARPATMERVMWERLLASGADIILNCPLATNGVGSYAGSVKKSGTRITGLMTVYGLARGRHFMECAYEGDIIVHGGMAYTYGRESSSTLSPTIVAGYNPGTSLGYGEANAGINLAAGVQYSGADFTTGGIGNPIYPLIANPSPTTGAGSTISQPPAFRYKLRLLSNGNAALATKPPGYNALKYAGVAKKATSLSMQYLGSYSASPRTAMFEFIDLNNNLIDVNNKGLLSNDLPNIPSLLGIPGYAEGTPTQRALYIKECREWCQGLLYFLQNDASVPAALRSDAQLYGLPTNEWTDSGYLPPLMYQRSGIRIIGPTVLTQSDVDTNGTKATSIAKNAFTKFDGHGSGAYLGASNDTIIQEGDTNGNIGIFAQIPMEVMFPRLVDCTNFQAVGQIASTTDFANRALRMEITQAQMGMAAGVIAAVALQSGVDVQSVSYSTVSTKLTNMGALY